jgi:L-ribulose-5-phosphate 3-epimerase
VAATTQRAQQRRPVHERIGYMQGRLSPQVDGKIQAFPWACWAEEFPQAERAGLQLMEWTLDQQRLHENPLLTPSGQAQIRTLCAQHRIAIPSLTGDCFMQAPFWKVSGAARAGLERDFAAIAAACAAVGITFIVVPLVDNGRIETDAQRDALFAGLDRQRDLLRQHRLRVAFESDYEPQQLASFIAALDPGLFGINYDIGNSAALGYDPTAEIAAYGDRILNVHVKDRVLGGTTVPLGTGNADFGRVFAALGRLGYGGNYILQTARASAGNHAEVLNRYRDMTAHWIQNHGA